MSANNNKGYDSEFQDQPVEKFYRPVLLCANSHHRTNQYERNLAEKSTSAISHRLVHAKARIGRSIDPDRQGRNLQHRSRIDIGLPPILRRARSRICRHRRKRPRQAAWQTGGGRNQCSLRLVNRQHQHQRFGTGGRRNHRHRLALRSIRSRYRYTCFRTSPGRTTNPGQIPFGTGDRCFQSHPKKAR